jgi:hypothetical protein
MSICTQMSTVDLNPVAHSVQERRKKKSWRREMLSPREFSLDRLISNNATALNVHFRKVEE